MRNAMRRAAALGLLSLCVACTPGAPRSATGAASDRGGPADLVVRYTATPGSPFEIGTWYRRWARYGITVTNHPTIDNNTATTKTSLKCEGCGGK